MRGVVLGFYVTSILIGCGGSSGETPSGGSVGNTDAGFTDGGAQEDGSDGGNCSLYIYENPSGTTYSSTCPSGAQCKCFLKQDS